jgi:hypothetical protein
LSTKAGRVKRRRIGADTYDHANRPASRDAQAGDRRRGKRNGGIVKKYPLIIASFIMVLALSCASTGSKSQPKASSSASQAASSPEEPEKAKRTLDPLPSDQVDSAQLEADVARLEKVNNLAEKLSASSDQTIQLLSLMILVYSMDVTSLAENRQTAKAGELYDIAQDYRKAIDEMTSTTKADKLLEALNKVKELDDKINYLDEPAAKP